MANKLNRGSVPDGHGGGRRRPLSGCPPDPPGQRGRHDHRRRGGRLALREILRRARRRIHQGDRRRGRLQRHPARHYPPAIRPGRDVAARAASTSTSPTRCGCRSSPRRASSSTSPTSHRCRGQGRLRRRALETVPTWAASSTPCRSSSTTARCTTAPTSSRRPGLSAPPATWDEYRAFAEEAHQGRGVYGTLIAGKQDIEATTRLQSFIQQAGGDILDANNKPTLRQRRRPCGARAHDLTSPTSTSRARRACSPIPT